MPKSTGARNRFRALQVIGYIDVKKRSNKNKKTLKNVKNVTKIKKNVCKSNKKRYLFLV